MTAINGVSEWTKLMQDPLGQVGLGPGEQFKQTIDKLVLLMNKKGANPLSFSEEKTYQTSIKDVYNKFKARVSQFQLDLSVSKGALLKELALDQFRSVEDTFNQLIGHYRTEAIFDFRVPLDPQINKVNVSDIIKKVNDRATSLANLDILPTPEVRQKIKKELAELLLIRHRKAIENRINRLKNPDIIKELTPIFSQDLKQEKTALTQNKAQLDTEYSTTNQTALEECLKSFELELKRIEERLKEVALRLGEPDSSIQKLTSKLASLPNSPDKQELNYCLKTYPLLLDKVKKKKEEIIRFLDDKKTKIGDVESRLKSIQSLLDIPREMEHYTERQRSTLQKEYDRLLHDWDPSLRDPIVAAPAPVLPVASALIRQEMAPPKGALYKLALGVSVCAVYYGLYYGMRSLAERMFYTE